MRPSVGHFVRHRRSRTLIGVVLLIVDDRANVSFTSIGDDGKQTAYHGIRSVALSHLVPVRHVNAWVDL